MAVPKRKSSKARRDKRRNNVWKLDMPAFSKCPQCGELKTPHRVCGNCGYYKGKEIIKKEASATFLGTRGEGFGPLFFRETKAAHIRPQMVILCGLL